MTSRPGLSFAAILIILSGFLFAVVLGIVLLSFIPVSMSTNSTPRSSTEQRVAPKQETAQPESIEGISKPSEPTVAVEVIDAASRPVEAASIHDVRNYSTALADTDVDGKCSIPHAALQFERIIDVATIRVEHPKYAPQMVRFARHSTTLRVVMTDMGTLIVRVVDAKDVPIPRATVELDEPERSLLGSPWVSELKADDNGTLTLSALRPGPFIVRAWAAGFAEGRMMAFATAKEIAGVKVVLQKGRTLDVRVSTRDGTGIPGSKVTLTNPGGVTGWSPETGVIRGYWTRATSADGVATFESLPSALSEIHLSVEGPTHPPKHEEILLEESVRRVELTVDSGATLIVDVLDAKGASVGCGLFLYASRGFESQELSVDKAEGGPARFTGVAAGAPVDVTVRRHGAVVAKEARLELAAGEERSVTIRLLGEQKVDLVARDGEGVAVGGRVEMIRVSGSGSIVPGSSDSVIYVAMLTPEGLATLSMLPGSYEALFQPKEGWRVEKKFTVQGDTRVEFEVATGRTAEAILVDPSGQPLPGCEVSWGSEGGRWGTVTGSDGRFRLRRLTGDSGSMFIEIQGFQLPVYQGPFPSDGRFVAPISTITGRILLRDGRPTPAMIQIQGGGVSQQASTRIGNVFGTAADGTFKVRVPAGRWTVWAWSIGTEASAVPVDVTSPGSTAVLTVTLAPVHK